jgi:citrate lyase alpha subunit
LFLKKIQTFKKKVLMFGVKDKVLLKKRQGLFIQRTGLWKGMTRSFHKAFQGSRLKGSPKRYLSPKQASRNPYIH